MSIEHKSRKYNSKNIIHVIIHTVKTCSTL